MMMLIGLWVLSFIDFIQGGQTALHAACSSGCRGIVEMLLDAKADVNMKDSVSESPSMLIVYVLSFLMCIKGEEHY